jgi:hypothetical protein
MKFKIIQKQSRGLLEEHAKSSFNFGSLGRNELYVAIGFFLIGAIISLLFDDNRLVGLPFILIGLFEIIKYPTREKRWVKKKEKEKLFNKDLEFEISDDNLKISFDEESKIHHYESMRQCLISETGILFKISCSEYFYLSFKSLESDLMKLDLIKHLKSQFKNGKIKEKRTHNNG